MEAPPLERRLVAILAADVEGYSRLMHGDEEATMATLSARRAFVDELIARHRGRIANTAGDSVLAEFASVLDAVRCAIEIQAALQRADEGEPEARRMRFRIGINVGDVMVKDDDIFGDGVNGVTTRFAQNRTLSSDQTGPGLSSFGASCINARVWSSGSAQSRSACLDRPDLHSTFIDRDCRQFAVALGRQTSEVIHDRLPFLGLADTAVSHPYGDAVFIYRTRRRQQVGGVLARVVKCLDPRREGLTRLVLGHKRQQALRVLWYRHGNKAEIQGAREAKKPFVCPGDVDSMVAAVEVSQFDCRRA